MKKKFLLVAGILAIGSITAGNYYWNEKNIEMEVIAKQTLGLPLDEKEQEIAKSIEKKSGSTSNATIASKEGSSKSSKQTELAASQNESKTTSGPTNKSTDIGSATNQNKNENEESSMNPKTEQQNQKPEKKSLEQIKSDYEALFRELEAQETSKADQLVVEAKGEYVSGKLSKAELAAKYKEIASIMEKNADRQFYALYQQLQIDLDKNGYNINEAQSFKNTYEAKKQERISRVTSQVSQF
jgi:hypothetical protein